MENRLYYKEKLIVQIGEEIKLTRKANNDYEEQAHRHFAFSLWAYGSSTWLLDEKESRGIYKQIMNTI